MFRGPRGGGEWKFLDINGAATAMNTTGYLQCLSTLKLGNTASTRIGLKVAWTSIEIRAMTYVGATAVTSQVVRWGLILDKQPNATMATMDNIYAAAPYYRSPRNLENRRRFKTIMDKPLIISAYGDTYDHRWQSIYVKFRRPIVTYFNAADNGTIADITSNALLFVLSGSNIAGNTAGIMDFTLRLRYTDF